MITNGDFEEYTSAEPQNPSGSYTVAGTDVPGWTVEGTVRIIPSLAAAWGSVPSALGTHYICLHSLAGATISTTVTGLQVDAPYVLTWRERRRPSYGTKNLIVTAGNSQDVSTHVTLADHYVSIDSSWEQKSGTFAATASSMVFRFYDNGHTSDASVFLDDISLLSARGWCAAGERYSVPSGYSGQGVCEACAAGKYNSEQQTGAMNCKLCAAGMFASEEGHPICRLCAAGMFASEEGRTVSNCKLCTAGTFASEDGQTSCKLCAAGLFSSEQGLVAVCRDCPRGWAQGTAAKRACIGCVPGRYQPAIGRAKCLSCPQARGHRAHACELGQGPRLCGGNAGASGHGFSGAAFGPAADGDNDGPGACANAAGQPLQSHGPKAVRDRAQCERDCLRMADQCKGYGWRGRSSKCVLYGSEAVVGLPGYMFQAEGATNVGISDAAPDGDGEACYVRSVLNNTGVFPIDFDCGGGFRLKDGASGILASAEGFSARRTQCCDPDPFVFVPGPSAAAVSGAAAVSESNCSFGHSSMERAAAACSADGGCAVLLREAVLDIDWMTAPGAHLRARPPTHPLPASLLDCLPHSCLSPSLLASLPPSVHVGAWNRSACFLSLLPSFLPSSPQPLLLPHHSVTSFMHQGLNPPPSLR